MGPRPIQDITPPPPPTNSPAEPPPVESENNSTGPSAPGPEIIGDIPVRASAGYAADEPKPPSAKDDDSSFFVPATPLPTAINKDNQKPKTKDSNPKPTLAILVAVLAIIFLAAGTYLKFFSNR